MKFFAPLAATLALAGCAALPPEGGMAPVAESIRAEIGKDVVKTDNDEAAREADARARGLLRKPLTADRAVQIALFENKGLQAAYNGLGLSGAKFAQASAPPNPAISVLDLRGRGEFAVEQRLVGDLLALATLPSRREIAGAAYRKAELEAISATVRLATEVRRQYWRAVAAGAQAAYLEQARSTAAATSELANKLGETGALNKLDQGREHVFYMELSARLARARTARAIEKERLTRLLGLWGANTQFTLPAGLPPLPKRIAGSRDIEARALERRVDLKVARAELERTALELGLTNATRAINVFELSAARNASGKTTFDGGELKSDRSTLRGVELKIEIPLYDFGAARQREAEQTYMRAAHLLAERAVDIRSEAREAWIALRGAHDVARLYESRILPLRQQIQSESLLQYNGMIADVFVLLRDARARIDSNVAAIDARRDYFLADTDLGAALLSGDMSGAGATADATPARDAGGEEH